jgi:hypothetical protein
MFIKAVFPCLDYFISSPESSWRAVHFLFGGVKPILTFFAGAGGGGSKFIMGKELEEDV